MGEEVGEPPLGKHAEQHEPEGEGQAEGDQPREQRGHPNAVGEGQRRAARPECFLVAVVLTLRVREGASSTAAVLPGLGSSNPLGGAARGGV